MNRCNSSSIQLILGCFLVLCGLGTSHAAGLLTPRDSSLPELELRAHHVTVIIEDGYAITSVEQIFHNPNSRDLEAIYSFPVPEKAAVSEFTMWIDKTPIHGEVLEKQQARRIYEEQKAAGNDVGLTEKDSYKTFDISVSPVRAGQDTRIRFSYIQPAKVDSAMGHYLYPLEEGGVDDAKLSFWTANETVSTDFSFDLTLRPSYPVDGIRLPGHPNASITKQGDEYHIHLGSTTSPKGAEKAGQLPPATSTEPAKQQGAVALAPEVKTGPAFTLDKDIVVYYRHADNLPGSVDLVAHKAPGQDRGTFMLTVTPAMDLKPLTTGQDWVFVLDISGSMQGKYNTLAEGVSQALGKMSPSDRFRIILFNNNASELTHGYTAATKENVHQYISRVKAVKAGGGTNVYDGLQLGVKQLDSDRTSAILLVTDGVANVGTTDQKKFIKLIRSVDVRLFTFIIGNSANRPLLTAITNASNGFSMHVSNSDDIVGAILTAKSKVTHQALHGAKLSIKGIKATDFSPETLGSIYRGQQLILFGHYFGAGEARVELSGNISGQKVSYQTRFTFPDTATSNPELERLWAYASIEELSAKMEDFGEDSDSKDAIIDLALEYGLVTDYTSMLVLEEEVFQKLGIQRNNRTRLETEALARSQRAQTKSTGHRVDTAQPMFNHSQPTTRSGSGAGAMDTWALLLLLPLLFLVRKKHVLPRP